MSQVGPLRVQRRPYEISPQFTSSSIRASRSPLRRRGRGHEFVGALRPESVRPAPKPQCQV